MLHTGYLFGTDSRAPVDPSGRSYAMQGATIGIGGAMRVHLWKLLRVGFEGYVSTLHSALSTQHAVLQSGSYLRTGCGGLNADVCWRHPKAWPHIGASIGGGAVRALYIVRGSQNDWVPEPETYVNSQSFGYVSPYVGCDWCATPKLHLTCRFDWMLAFAHHELVLPTGPRLYLGLMFTH